MKRSDSSLKEKLIKQAVKKLRLFGFVHVNTENILTDDVYKLYFIKILYSNLKTNKDMDNVINEILKTVDIEHRKRK